MMEYCLWCRKPRKTTAQKWCSKKCRQTAWRFRKIQVLTDPGDRPLKLAYADPPYPGLSKKYYQHEKTYAGEVDHEKLLSLLATYDGWALSTSRKALRDILPLCPAKAIICPWVKTHHQPVARGPGNIHEYVIVSPGRYRQPGPADAFVGAVARGGDSDLIGRKPIKFIQWVFSLLGASPVDQLHDLFPGSGIVSRCWDEFRRSAPATKDVFLPGSEDVFPAVESLGARGDVSQRSPSDISFDFHKDERG